MKSSQRVVKNILAGGAGVGLGGLLQLAAVACIARSVGVAEFGTYSFILAFAMFFQLLADSGLSNILVRELATRPRRMAEIVGAAAALAWWLTAAAAVLMLAVIPWLRFSVTLKALIGLMGAATLAQFHATLYGAVLRSQEDNEWHALGFLLHKVLFCACVLAGLKMRLGLLAIVLAHLVPNLCQWAFYLEFIRRAYGVRIALRRDLAEWKYLLTHSLPVGGATMLRLFAQQIDVMILTVLTDLRTVGLFSGPYRIAQAMRFIPQTIAQPLYPAYARLAVAPERPPFGVAYERSIKVFLVVGCAVATLFTAGAAPMITLLLGPQFRAAEPAMQWLGLAFIPFFAATPYPLLLTALHEQKFLLVATIGSLGARILLNFLLIPPLGFLGPALAFFAGETLFLLLGMARLWRLGFVLSLLEIGWRPVLASAALGGILWWSRGRAPATFLAAAGGGMALYALLIYRLGTFSSEELALGREALAFAKPLLRRWSAPPQYRPT